MIIRTRQAAIQVVNSTIERLKSLYGLDDMLDDGWIAKTGIRIADMQVLTA